MDVETGRREQTEAPILARADDLIYTVHFLSHFHAARPKQYSAVELDFDRSLFKWFLFVRAKLVLSLKDLFASDSRN